MSQSVPEATPFLQRPAVRWGGGGLILLASLVAWRSLGGGKDAAVGPRAVPVLVATAARGDLDQTLSSLGTVTAVNAALVRSRVDGVLQVLHFQEGQLVSKGQLLAEIDPRPFQVQLMSAEGQLAKDSAALNNAKADQGRVQKLVAQGIVSKQVSDTQDTSVAQLEAAVQADRAAVESAKLNLTYSRVSAPVSGRVGLRLVEPGNMVRATDTTGLVTIAPVSPITVIFTVPSDAIQSVLASHRKGALGAEAFDRENRQRLATGKVAAIDNQVDPTTGTVKLRAEYDNRDGALYPNQFVNVRLRVDTLKGVVLIPTVAVQRSPKGAFVYVIKADETVDMRPVEIAGTDGNRTAIAKGLESGESVVSEGLERLRPGAKVSLPKPEGQGTKGKGK